MKPAEIESVILRLLTEKPEISVADVAKACGLSKSDEGDRKAIRRVLTKLTGSVLEPKGHARARVYTQ